MRRFFYTIPILVVLLAVLLGVSFLLVPTDRLNALIDKQLSDAFGYPVTVSGTPSVSLFPYLAVSFGPLLVSAPDKPNAPLMEIERANGRLSVTSLWEGAPSLRFITLERAKIRVTQDADGALNWSPDRFFTSDNDEKTPATLRFPKRLRTVSLVDSTLIVESTTREEPEKVTSINGTLVGPPRASRLAFDGSFIWRGELVTMQAGIQSPEVLIKGEVAPASLSLTSARLNLSFDGTISWNRMMIGVGSYQATVPSAQALATWFGYKGVGVLPTLPMRLVGDGRFSFEKLTLRPLAVRIGDNSGAGLMEVDLKGRSIGLKGTLAYDQLAIKTDKEKNGFVGTIEPVVDAGRDGALVDLRLSADRLTLDNQRISNAALTLVLGEKELNLNIGSATLDTMKNGGEVTPRLFGDFKIAFDQKKYGLDASLTLSNANTQLFEKILRRPLPFSSALSASIRATGLADDIASLFDNTGLKFEADLRQPTLKGLHLGSYFDGNIENVNGSNKETRFQKGRLKLAHSPENQGLVDVLELVNEAGTLTLNGAYNTRADALNLIGTWRRAEAEEGVLAPETSMKFGKTLKSLRLIEANETLIPMPENTQ